MTTCPAPLHAPHLIGTGEAEPVEDRDEDVGRDEKTQEVGTAQEPVLCAVGIDLWGGAQDGHGWLESGQQGERDGQAAHTAISQQELLRGTLAPPGEGVEESDAHRSHQEDGEDHVIHAGEMHLNGVRHGSGFESLAGCVRACVFMLVV